jgi:hypothetical protein
MAAATQRRAAGDSERFGRAVRLRPTVGSERFRSSGGTVVIATAPTSASIVVISNLPARLATDKPIQDTSLAGGGLLEQARWPECAAGSAAPTAYRHAASAPACNVMRTASGGSPPLSGYVPVADAAFDRRPATTFGGTPG